MYCPVADFPQADLLEGDRILEIEEILAFDDQVFEPGSRPNTELALRLITGEVSGWTVPFASATFDHHRDTPDQGLFTCLFGRDSLIIANLLGREGSKLLLNVVCALAEYQGSQSDWASEEQPGRIPHEVRQPTDPQAIKIIAESGWKFPYYGSVDATLLWLCALERLSRSDSDLLERKVRGQSLSSRAEQATLWVIDRISQGRGWVRSNRTNPKGILNQVWKDSGDSYLTASGQLALETGTASIETVGESYDALVSASKICARTSSRWALSPKQLTDLADELRARLLNSWWLGDRFALGIGSIDGRETLLDAIASNQWRLLDSTILDGAEFSEFVNPLVNGACDPEILGPHGIRTLGKSNPRYRPAGYHTGSSWPVDSALVVRGLLRHQAIPEATEISRLTLGAIEGVGAYPELFRSDLAEPSGVSRFVIDVWDPALQGRNRVCQPPQLLQGWTVAAYDFLTKQKTTLGLR